MRRFSTFLAASVVSLSVLASVDHDTSLVLEPQMEQRYASNLATKFLTNWHYKDTRLDDDLSSQIFDAYIKLLDPNRIYFLAGDIEMFERYRTGLDDSLRHSDLAPAYEIFNVYIDRVRQRVDYTRQRIQKPFDFTVDEAYRFDREGEPWASNTAELDEMWRHRIKNDYLRLKLVAEPNEIFAAVFLDSLHQVLAYEPLFRGTINATSVYPRVVVQRVLELNAAAVVFAHQHPSGVSEPSSADRMLTQQLQAALALIDVRVLDHIIVGQGAPFSFAESGLL